MDFQVLVLGINWPARVWNEEGNTREWAGQLNYNSNVAVSACVYDLEEDYN